ncbi:MAG TPA: invasion associated locus B family protein [Gammaproteobacteria bacterium]|nr:invasion associated locus B family protein [Gammaproteobacteria bacterium]
MRSFHLTFVLICLLATRAAVAEVIGVYRDWVAVTSTSGNEKTCMIWSQPKQSEGYKGKRGDAFAFVTHQPADKRLDRVSFETGYKISKPDALRATVGERQFQLSASGSGAWTRNSADDSALIEAMRAGSTMTVTGNGPGGETVKDSYSLYGFTAAYNAISAACKVR